MAAIVKHEELKSYLGFGVDDIAHFEDEEIDAMAGAISEKHYLNLAALDVPEKAKYVARLCTKSTAVGTAAYKPA